MTGKDGDESILGQIQPLRLTDEQVRNLSAVQEAINSFVGHCSERIWIEEKKATPDQDMLDHWNDELRKAARARRFVRADDPDGVRDVLDYYNRRVRELNEVRKGDRDGGSRPR